MKNSNTNKYYYFLFAEKPEISGAMSVVEARAVRTAGKIYGLHGITPSASTLLGTIDKNGTVKIHH